MTNDSFHKMEHAQVEDGVVYLGWPVRRRDIDLDQDVEAVKVRAVEFSCLGRFSPEDVVLAVSTAKPCMVEFPHG